MGKVLQFGKPKAKSVPEQPVKPLFTQHMQRQPGQPDDFSDRLTRIRASLQRINTLMAELKRISQEQHSAGTHNAPVES
jgi:hypothetical protein